MPAQAQKRVTLFLTYAHEDRRLMEQFKHSLSSLEQEGKVASWNDRDIKAGIPLGETNRCTAQ